MTDAEVSAWDGRQDAAITALAEARASRPTEAAAKMAIVFSLMNATDVWGFLSEAEGELLRSVHADLLAMGGTA